MLGRCGFLFALLSLSAGPVYLLPGQSREPLTLPRLAQAIQLDGKLDDDAWQRIAVLPVVTHVPTFDEAPSQRTELRVAYDDHYLYFAAHCFDDKDGIVASSFRRDGFLPGSDYVGLILDSFGDNENALVFLVKPTGARVDFAVFNDAQGRVPFSESWNTFWDAAVTHTQEGWFAEIRIPFSSLRFQDDDGRVIMGLTAARFRARDVEWVTFPSIRPNWGLWSFLKPSQAQPVALEGIRARKPIYLTPYLMGGLARRSGLDAASAAYVPINDRAYDAGVDLKYSPASNLTVDLTVNTDFAQVEADNQQVNLTRFSLFFPEQRLFFQERASLFEFGTSEAASVFSFSPFSSSRLFYSRRIGLYGDQPVRMLGGARLMGRFGGWDVALLNVQTAKEADVLADRGGLPSQNLGVARFRRQVFNEFSYAGGMLTSQLSTRGEYNVAYGFDALVRPFGDEYVALVWSQTLEEDSEALTMLDRARVHARWERRRFDGFGYDLSLVRSGPAYNPSLGFSLRQDYMRFGDQIFYGWLPGNKSLLQRHQLSINGAVFLRNGDGSTESAEVGSEWVGTLRSGANFRVTAAAYYEDLRVPLRFPEYAVVPADAYLFHALQGRYQTPTGRPFNLNTSASAGTFFGGNRFSLAVEPAWVVSRHLELIGFYEINRIDFPARNGPFHTHVGRLRVRAALSTAMMASAFVQYNSSADNVVVNVRLRYNAREGNDLYLVYNEGLNTDRYRLVPVLPLSGERTVLLKYIYTLPI